jgi:hypothetical protein
MPAAAPAPEHAESFLARIFHESLAATTDMAVLPGVLGCSFDYAQDKLTQRRTVQVRKPTPCGSPVARPPRLSARDGGQARPSNSRSLSSAQFRKRVPSLALRQSLSCFSTIMTVNPNVAIPKPQESLRSCDSAPSASVLASDRISRTVNYCSSCASLRAPASGAL